MLEHIAQEGLRSSGAVIAGMFLNGGPNVIQVCVEFTFWIGPITCGPGIRQEIAVKWLIVARIHASAHQHTLARSGSNIPERWRGHPVSCGEGGDLMLQGREAGMH